MQAPSFKNTALALCLTVAGSFSASAQQARTPVSAEQIAAMCAHLRSPAQNAQCQHDKHLAEANARLGAANIRLADAQRQSAVADTRVAAANDAAVCARFLLAKKAEGVALDPTRLNRDKGCVYAAELGMK